MKPDFVLKAESLGWWGCVYADAKYLKDHRTHQFWKGEPGEVLVENHDECWVGHEPDCPDGHLAKMVIPVEGGEGVDGRGGNQAP